ncbi:hypothetical protein A2U01_0066192, partial [Trifolium medium]|nr:hypothetical protein [Trifolium medium]
MKMGFLSLFDVEEQANRLCCSAWFATRTNLRCSELGRIADEEAPAIVRCDSLGGSLQRTGLDS